MTKKAEIPAPKCAETKVPHKDPIAALIDICERLRKINTDGYIQKSTWLANIKPFGFTGRLTKATVCSPFTGTVCGMLFDKDYASKDVEKDPFIPMFDDGKTILPYDFYHVHNDIDQPVQSLEKYKIGHKVKNAEMRRGDIVAIDWVGGGGHVVFCWDVHLDSNGNVDCFQMLGSHGSLKGNGYGVHISGCTGERWLKGKPAKFNQPGTGNLEKAKDKIFVDEEQIVREGVWFALPGVKLKNIDPKTFKFPPGKFAGDPWGNAGCTHPKFIVTGRFNYDGKPPEPYSTGTNSGGPAPAEKKEKPGHADAKPIVIKKPEIKKDPEAIKKVEPKPAPQDPKKPLMMQKDVELAMQEFFRVKWIKSDPGVPDEVADSKSQAAVKDFQTLFKLDADGIVGKITLAEIKKQLPACHRQMHSEETLGDLFRGGILKKDSGPPTGFNDDETKAAVEEFQGLKGLKKTGVPDADTLAALDKAALEHKPSDAKQGLNPRLEALYWLGNQVATGGPGKLRLHSEDLKKGQALKIFLKNGDKEEESKVPLVASAEISEVAVPLPASFGVGSVIFARVEAALDGGKKAEMKAPAPLYVRSVAGPIEEFFKLKGDVGERETPKDHTYIAYKVAGKPQAWFMKGRFMTDLDGAPNCYHPKDLNVRLDYQKFDLMEHKGALDWLRNGGHPGNWFGVVTDNGKKDGNPVVQTDKDPCPGFYVSSTSLHGPEKDRRNPKRYVDARQIPYLAFNYQVYAEGGGRFTRISAGPTGRLGDFLTAVNPDADEEHRFAHAIFADVGGSNSGHFGEGSPALGKKIKAHGLAFAKILYIVYPHSGANQGTIPTAEEIQQKGEKLFSEWGGMDEAKRVLGLMPK